MAYHGSRVAGVATNPIAIAVPGDSQRPLLLDMTTAVASLDKLMHARNTNTPVPDGWALDADGESTNDPIQASLPLPLGGPKGAGLSVMFGCLASLLAGSPIIAQALLGEGAGRRHRQNAVLVAIHIVTFTELDGFKKNVD